LQKPFPSACGSVTQAVTGGSSSANGYFACWLCFAASMLYCMEAVPAIKSLASAHVGNQVVMYLVLASLVLLCQVITDSSNKSEWKGIDVWALCVAIFSTLAGIILLLQAARNYAKYINLFLTLLWFTAVATLTYRYKDTDTYGAYAQAGNGFFSIWVAFFIAFVLGYTAWVEGTNEAHLNDPNVYVAVILMAGFYEMWSAGTICDNIGSDNCKDELAWALAAGVISTFLCLVVTIMLICGKSVSSIHPPMAILMALLWTAAAAVCTFKAPFINACTNKVGTNLYSGANGFFACWICFVAALRYVQLVIPALQGIGGPNDSLLGGILLGSFVLLAQAVWDGDENGFDNDRGKTYAWAVAVGAVSFFLGLCMLFKATAGYTKHIALFLSLWWFIAVATLTFTYKDNNKLGVYAQASNGFFATWIAFFSAFALMYTTWLGQGHASQGTNAPPASQQNHKDPNNGGSVMV